MRRKSVEAAICPIAGALDLVGDWWTLLIMRDVLDGFSRFDELEHNLGIAPTMLTTRLRSLVDANLISRRPYSTRPTRYEYLPTESGRALESVIIALYHWGTRFSPVGSGQAVLVDQDTGDEIVPVLVDRDSGRPLRDMPSTFIAGPNADPRMQQRLDPERRRARRERNHESP